MAKSKTGLTPSEELVNELSSSSFLHLWTHPNPIGKGGKELCDCLVVCGPHLIIISVKEIEFRDTGDKVGWERWQKSAIDKSVQQIWGAERWLRDADTVVRADGREIALPPKSDRIYLRLTVSLGGRGKVPLKWGDLGHGFVHLLDEYSLKAIFAELSTITDFVRYLTAAERLFERGVRPVFLGAGVEDLLALYVQRGEEAHDGRRRLLFMGRLTPELAAGPTTSGDIDLFAQFDVPLCLPKGMLEAHFGRSPVEAAALRDGHSLAVFGVAETYVRGDGRCAAAAVRMVTMPTTRNCIPVESSYERHVAEHLKASGRRFSKPLRYDAASEVHPDFLLHDQGPDAYPLEVYGMRTPEYLARKAEKAAFYAARYPGAHWSWDATRETFEDAVGRLPLAQQGRAQR